MEVFVLALINCPECGKEVSDKAKSCPNCGCPIEDSRPDGMVRIKMCALKAGFNGKQEVTLSDSNGKTLWTGYVGQIAEVYFEGTTTIEVQYHLSLMHYGGTCSGVVDPSKGKKYAVQVRQGIMKTVMEFQMVDVIDSD